MQETLLILRKTWGMPGSSMWISRRLSLKYKNQEKTDWSKDIPNVVVDPEQLIVNYQGDGWKKVDDAIKGALKGSEKLFAYDEPVVKVPPPPTFTQTEFKLDEAAKTTTATFRVQAAGADSKKTDEVFGAVEAALKGDKAAKVRRIKPSGDVEFQATGLVFDLLQIYANLVGAQHGIKYGENPSELVVNPVKALGGCALFDAYAVGVIDGFKKSFDFLQELGAQQKWLLNFAYGSIYKKHKKMSPADIDAVVKKAEDEGHPIPPEQIEQMKLRQMTK